MCDLQTAASLFASFTSTEIRGAHQKEKSLEEKEARKDPTALDTWQLLSLWGQSLLQNSTLHWHLQPRQDKQ